LTTAKRPNPYDYVADVKDPRLFAGRQAELALIGDELLRVKATPPFFPIIALVGERRVGKTSILHRVTEFALDHRILPCHVNLVSAVAGDPWEFWHDTLQAILTAAFKVGAVHDGGASNPFGFHLPTAPSPVAGSPIPDLFFARLYQSRPPIGGAPLPPAAALVNDLRSLLHPVTQVGYLGALLLFDEAHLLSPASDVNQQLRHVVRTVEGLALVFSGEPVLNQMFTDPSAPFYLQAKVVPAGNFMKKEDMAECALLPLTESERPLVNPMTIDHLSRLSHGKPNQIRLLCHSIYRRYERQHQSDLNVTIEAIDDVLDDIQASYAADYGLKDRIDAIRRLGSVDLEVLYLATRFPQWRVDDIVALDEAFRGQQLSPRAALRRSERLQSKQKTFVAMGLLEDRLDRYTLAGDEFVRLYLRFWYEVRKYGDLSKRLRLGEGPITPFGEKVDKLVVSLPWEVHRNVEFMTAGFSADESPREQAILKVRQRFAALDDVVSSRSVDAAARARSFLDCFNICELVRESGAHYLLVLAIRNLENPRESILAEIYFQGAEPVVFPLSLLREQAAGARIVVEDFDAWLVNVPSLEDLVKAVSGIELEEILGRLPTVDEWRIRSIRRHIVKPGGERDRDKAAAEAPEAKRTWISLYRKGDKIGAIDAITAELGRNPGRPAEARLYNDRGYIRYEVRDQVDLAKKDLQSAIDLHHGSLPLTLLNLAVIAIDGLDYGTAIEQINDALLITLGRESVRASYLRLRLLPGLPMMTQREKWEQNPANVLEAAYVNLAYAVARTEGYQAALGVLEEGRELMPLSAHLLHALARLHLWGRHANLADPLYRQLAEMGVSDQDILHEVKLYLRTGKMGRRKKA
jgi:tetratricopeptide (TPR) repeat protein